MTEFRGCELAGRKFNYVVETGSTTPRTSLQKEETAKWLYQVGAIGRQGLLEALNWENWKEEIERSAEGQLGQALQILIEADFIVNLYEDNASENAVRNAYEKIFVTESGKKILKDSFGL